MRGIADVFDHLAREGASVGIRDGQFEVFPAAGRELLPGLIAAIRAHALDLARETAVARAISVVCDLTADLPAERYTGTDWRALDDWLNRALAMAQTASAAVAAAWRFVEDAAGLLGVACPPRSALDGELPLLPPRDFVPSRTMSGGA